MYLAIGPAVMLKDIPSEPFYEKDHLKYPPTCKCGGDTKYVEDSFRIETIQEVV